MHWGSPDPPAGVHGLVALPIYAQLTGPPWWGRARTRCSLTVDFIELQLKHLSLKIATAALLVEVHSDGPIHPDHWGALVHDLAEALFVRIA